MPTLGGVLTNCSSNLPPRAVKPSLLGLRVRACMGDCVSDTPLSRRAGLVGPSAHARTYTDARVHGRQELLARSARILKLTLNPQPSTLNPQPSTLNGRQKLLARTVGMFKNKSLVVSVSHLPLSLCVRTNGHACSRLAACALKRLLVFALACACRLVCPRACVAGQTACGMRAGVHIAVRIACVMTAIVADRPLQICFDAWRRDTEERRRQKAAGEKPGENPDKKKCSCCAVS